MREHEVPTHVQAEDKVLLWFTFPQIVAVVAVCAVAYGAFHYLPFGPMAVRLAVGVLIGIVGIAMTVGKIGGRGLPLVAADLLKFNLGARRYAGSPAQLALSEPPAPVETKPDPLRLLAKKAAGGLGRAVKAARRKGRAPFRPPRLVRQAETRGQPGSQGQPARRQRGPGKEALVQAPSRSRSAGRRRGRHSGPRPWPTTPMTRTRAGGWTRSTSCRRTRCRDAASTWNAWPSPATPPPLPCGPPTTWSFGSGSTAAGRARTLKMGANTSLRSGEARSYNLTLNGPSPSFTFSWTDALGRSGAVSLKSHQIPYPLPQADGGLCDLEVTSLEWTPGRITGVVASECIAETRHEIDLPVYGGHFSRNVPALLDATVTRITGTVSVAAGSHRATASFTPNGETRFRLPVANRRAVHELEITADLTATLNVPLPPMLRTTHHPARTDVYTRRVTCRCGESSTTRTVRIYVRHPEQVRAVETQRAPVTRTRPESIALAAGVGADAPFESLHVPPPPPPPARAEQTQAGGSNWWSWLWRGD